MHKLASKPITLDCFEIDDLTTELHIKNEAPIVDCSHMNSIQDLINYLEALRQKYLETKDKRYWKELVRWLPNGWLQTRTWTGSYANCRNMRGQRDNHKLTEWHRMCEAIDQMPYSKEFISYK